MTYGARLRELRAERQLSLREVEERGGPNKDTMSLIERGVHKPQPQTLGRIGKALGMGVAELRYELEAAEHPLGVAPPSPTQPPLNGFEEERHLSRFSEAIIAAAASWGEAISNPDMKDAKRLGLIQAALDLGGVIGERVEEENWDAIPNQERLAIVTTMEKLNEVANLGIAHLEESTEARGQEEQVNQRREQIRQWTQQIRSA